MSSSRQGTAMRKCKANTIQADLKIFKHVLAYSDSFKHNQAYSGIFRILCNPGIFRTLIDAEP